MSVDKKQVRVRIESESAQQKIVQNVDGELYSKGDHYYVRYAEPDPEMGRTMTTLRLDPRSVRIIRHGDVASEQMFTAGEEHVSPYATAHGTLEIKTRTDQLHFQLSEGLGTVRWTYRLTVSGEDAGLYSLTLTIQEAHPE